MTSKSPTQSRLVFFEVGDNESIRVPVTKKWVTLVYLSTCVVGWTVAGPFALLSIDLGSNLPFAQVAFALTLGFVGWALLLGYFTYSLVWAAFGHTTLTIGKDALTIGQHLPFWNRFKHYSLPYVYEMRWEETSPSDKANRSVEWERGKGRIEFQHGGKTKVAVQGVTRDESRAIIDALNAAAAPILLSRPTVDRGDNGAEG